MSQAPLLQIKQLSIQISQYSRGLQRRSLSPIRELSLSLYPGEMLALAGASGSGKSLLAAAVLGLLPYNASLSGAMYYEGAALSSKRQRQLRGKEISLVPQSVASLDPLMKVGRQMRQGDESPKNKERCLQLLSRYGLGPEVAELYPFQLSGGMARRVLIAMALMQRPRLVIADEPTPGLDQPTARRVLQHFRELTEEGIAVLLITHDLPLALEVAHRVSILYDGRNIEEAPAAAFSRPEQLRHPYSRALLAASPARGMQSPEGEWPYGEVD
ncbi:MAG: ABC transporter ATP-binding protein [Firmicutes bacterium]|nr:ABC transporter ATP-binding protein [Bacillota bacterium]